MDPIKRMYNEAFAEPDIRGNVNELQRVKVYVGQDVYISLIQGRGAYCNEAATCEAAIIESGQVHEPEGWCSASDLVRVIRKAQRIANRRQAQFEATPDYLKPLWKGDSNGN